VTRPRPLGARATFMGYRRPDGRVGVRNHTLILPTSELLNRVAEMVGDAVPAAVAVTHHPTSTGAVRDFQLRVLAGFASNPNVGAALLVGLGEDELEVELRERVRGRSGAIVELHTLRAAGSVERLAVEVGERAAELCASLAAVPREPAPVSSLVVGTECGGSDAFSGLSANPAVGEAVDALVAEGATALLCELPELIGAEHLLARRAVSVSVASQVMDAILGWERLAIEMGEDLRGAQPSPGNQAGGITTVEEKALGGLTKGGTSPVVEVVGYGETPSRHGLVLMDTAGQDVEQLTAMAAGGAQIVVFTTGRGTPTASPIAPTIKISSNSVTAERLAEHIDIDAGPIIEGTRTRSEIASAILAMILAVSGGEITRAERCGQRDFALPRTAPSLVG
jgi:altronate dehydratase large subunit